MTMTLFLPDFDTDVFLFLVKRDENPFLIPSAPEVQDVSERGVITASILPLPNNLGVM